MKEIRSRRLTVLEANHLLGVEMEPLFWEALVRLIEYPELSYHAETETIRFPSYVPFEQLAAEWIEGVEQGLYDLRPCQGCGQYLDVSRTGGIYTDPPACEGFLCLPCAEAMTAREYYERFLAG